MQRSLSRVFVDLITIRNFAHVHCVISNTVTIKIDLLTFFAKPFIVKRMQLGLIDNRSSIE